MKRKIAKIAAFSFLTVFAVVLLGVGLFLWRLSRGPMTVSFLNSRIESAINSQLSDMKVKLGDAVLELDPTTNVPHMRFRNLVLSDNSGVVIASAPRAAVTLDPATLLTGNIAARSLELIGPKISAKRNLDGTMELGVGGQDTTGLDSLSQAASAQPENGTPQKSDRGADGADQSSNQTSGTRLIALLDRKSVV